MVFFCEYRDQQSLQQQLRNNTLQQEKVTQHIGIKDALHSDLLEFLKAEKVHLLPAHIQVETKEGAQHFEGESKQLLQSKQRLMTEYSFIEKRLEQVIKKHRITTVTTTLLSQLLYYHNYSTITTTLLSQQLYYHNNNHNNPCLPVCVMMMMILVKIIAV